MLRLLHNSIRFNYFYSPDEGGGIGEPLTPSVGGDMDKEEVIDFLGVDDDDEPILEIGKDKTPVVKKEKDDKEEKDETNKEDDKENEEDDAEAELKALEEELEEPTDEQLELVNPVRRREILKKYPELFKDFPYLEKAYYREQQFTNIYPTIDDAKEAQLKANVYEAFEADVSQGKTEKILSSLKKQNPDGFNNLVDDYLPTLARVDESAYLHVLGNMGKHTIANMVREGNKTKNNTLVAAAQVLNQFMFGSSEFTPPRNLSRTPNPETPENRAVNEREERFHQQQFQNTVGELNNKVNGILNKTIDGHIDPNESMTDYIRKNAARDAMGNLENLISRDTRFKALTDKLWQAAEKDGFSRESTDRIRQAYLSKAKTLLPSVIKKARNDALRGMGRKPKDDTETPVSSDNKKGPVTPGKPRSSDSGKIKSGKDVPKGMSTLEFLNS